MDCKNIRVDDLARLYHEVNPDTGHSLIYRSENEISQNNGGDSLITLASQTLTEL